jgi:hypothetical protein
MVLLMESERRTEDAAVASKVARQDEEQGSKIETRIHQRQCVQCRRWFWAWDPARSRCFVCDAPPPHEVKRILEAIHATTG